MVLQYWRRGVLVGGYYTTSPHAKLPYTRARARGAKSHSGVQHYVFSPPHPSPLVRKLRLGARRVLTAHEDPSPQIAPFSF
eukprot:2120937-Prymnesium_polylepis.1